MPYVNSHLNQYGIDTPSPATGSKKQPIETNPFARRLAEMKNKQNAPAQKPFNNIAMKPVSCCDGTGAESSRELSDMGGREGTRVD